MTFTKQDLYDLTTLSGGRFSVKTIEEAYNFCERLTKEHYENFPVASVLVPKRLRKYVYAVYAFARTADDISDELSDEPKETRINALNNYNSLIISSDFNNNIGGNPIFVALNDARKALTLPQEPFEKLITAFKMDIMFSQPETLADLLNYCHYSANPVGELILRIFNEYNEENAKLSDYICTALQLTNFWQDLSIDLLKNRNYIPMEYLRKHEIIEQNLLITKNFHILIGCLKELIDYNYFLYSQGANLINKVNSKRLRLELKATLTGGLKILDRVSKLREKIFFERPALNKIDVSCILIKTALVVIK